MTRLYCDYCHREIAFTDLSGKWMPHKYGLAEVLGFIGRRSEGDVLCERCDASLKAIINNWWKERK